MHSTLLRAITRRHFFKQSGFGIGGAGAVGAARRPAARAAGRRPARAAGAALRAEGQEHHLSVHGRRADAARPVRLQAGAAGARRPGDPGGVHSEGRALRVHQGDAAAARITVHVQASTDNPARSSPSCCRISPSIADEIAIVRSVHTTQFNHAPGQIFMNTGSQVFGRPSMGSWLTYGLGSESHDLPGLRRAALGRERARRRKVVLGQRIPADGLPGRRVPIEGRSGAVRLEPRTASTATARRGLDRSGDRPRTSCIGPKSAIPRSTRASRPTRWRTGCRAACRS